MQTFWLCILVVALLTVVDGRLEKKKAADHLVRSISSGTSFGMCRGYCRQSINVTSLPSQLIASKEPNFDQVAYPVVQRQFAFSSVQWDELVALLNLNTFQALGDTIGCPDCADGGAEWIQVNWSDQTKRVTFENGRAVKGIEGLIEKLRLIRQEYLAKL